MLSVEENTLLTQTSKGTPMGELLRRHWHPIAGASWEGFVLEQVAASLPSDAQMGFYRTSAGTELDLVIQRGARKIGVEIKFSSAPKPTRGFWQALEDLQIDRAYVIAPVSRRYPLAEHVDVVPVTDVATLLQ